MALARLAHAGRTGLARKTRLTRLVGLSHLLILLASLYTPIVTAHALEQSYIFLRFSDNGITGEVQLAVRDINKALKLHLPADMQATADDVAANLGAISAYVAKNIRLTADGTPVQMNLDGHDLLSTSFAQFAVLKFYLKFAGSEPRWLEVDYNVFLDELDNHVGMLVITDNWNTGTFNNESQVSLIFKPTDRKQKLDLTEGGIWQGLAAMISLGTHHISIGIDHIFFLLALLLPCVVVRHGWRWEAGRSPRESLWNVVKIVTVFTLAHSITLALAALDVARPDPRWVESLIALSIGAAALDILIPIFGRKITWVVFVFGLFHGFGFAAVLGEMGIPGGSLPAALLGFNIGVELGQLAIVLVTFPVLFVLRGTRFYRLLVLPVGAAGLLTASSYWFVERAFEIDLQAGSFVKDVVQRIL